MTQRYVGWPDLGKKCLPRGIPPVFNPVSEFVFLYGMKTTPFPAITPRLWQSGSQCKRQVWYRFHGEKEFLPPRPGWRTSVAKHLVHESARQLFPDGRFAARGEPLRQEGAWFDVWLESDRYACRADILVLKDKNKRTVDLYRVKSATRLYDRYLDDVAFQTVCLRAAGFVPDRQFIIHINPAAVSSAPNDLFMIVEVTSRLEGRLRSVPAKVGALRRVLRPEKTPDRRIGYHCMECGFRSQCWPSNVEEPVFWLPALTEDQQKTIRNRDWLDICQLPESFPVNQRQAMIREVHSTRQPFVHRTVLTDSISQLRFPLAFLDFEADNPPVPRYEGMKPFGQIPYQFSLLLYDESGRMTGIDYLHRDGSDPRPGLLDRLSVLKNHRGSIVVYNHQFERQILSLLAAWSPTDAGWLADAASRLWDLQEVVQHGLYLPEFQGKYSLKQVLNGLYPAFSYGTLAVQSGLDSQYLWNHLIAKGGDETDWQALLDYCRRDTEGMVLVLGKLKELVEKHP